MIDDAGRPVALVTGASRGLGLAIARTLGERFHVLLGGRDPAGLTELAAGFASAAPFTADLTDVSATQAAVAGIERLDVLVHSAGTAPYLRIEEADVAQWRRVLELNLVGVAELTRLLLPALREANGHVVVINAGLGLHTGPGWALYSASKYGLRAFTDTLRMEERGRVKVTAIHPGRIDTQMQREIYAAQGRPYRPGAHLAPATVARAVAYVLDAGDEAMVESLQIRPVEEE